MQSGRTAGVRAAEVNRSSQTGHRTERAGIDIAPCKGQYHIFGLHPYSLSGDHKCLFRRCRVHLAQCVGSLISGIPEIIVPHIGIGIPVLSILVPRVKVEVGQLVRSLRCKLHCTVIPHVLRRHGPELIQGLRLQARDTGRECLAFVGDLTCEIRPLSLRGLSVLESKALGSRIRSILSVYVCEHGPWIGISSNHLLIKNRQIYDVYDMLLVVKRTVHSDFQGQTSACRSAALHIETELIVIPWLNIRDLP